jgi:NTP pyrophosphatase (non-canonical NTP hydrolase)
VDLPEVQRKVDAAIRSFGGYWGEFELLARLTEELGEVARDLQRQRGMRPRPQKSNLEEEVGDLLFTIAAFANVQKIDLQSAFEQVLAKYEARDLKDWMARQKVRRAEDAEAGKEGG